MESFTSGTVAGTGTFRCIGCDYIVSLASADALPTCPGCGRHEFARASLFTDQQPSHQTLPTALAPARTPQLAEIRDRLDEAGQYLVYEEGAESIVYRLSLEWTRIGRSLAADIRFDDPTVSRRHALIVRQPDGVRVLDDRSLNGVYVNGERIEWRPLVDGDVLVVGRHHLHFVVIPVVSGVRPTSAVGADGATAG